MKLSKFLYLLVGATFLSLAYVWQQTEIFRLAYAGQKSVSVYQDLLDKNTVLRYNLDRDGSLIRIGEKFRASDEFEIPEHFRMVRLESGKKAIARRQPAKKENMLARLFVERQAEARTIKP